MNERPEREARMADKRARIAAEIEADEQTELVPVTELRGGDVIRQGRNGLGRFANTRLTFAERRGSWLRIEGVNVERGYPCQTNYRTNDLVERVKA